MGKWYCNCAQEYVEAVACMRCVLPDWTDDDLIAWAEAVPNRPLGDALAKRLKALAFVQALCERAPYRNTVVTIAQIQDAMEGRVCSPSA